MSSIPIMPRRNTGTIGADGTAIVSFGPVPIGTTWELDRISVQASSGGVTVGSEARIYGGGRLIAGTYSGGLDTAESGGRPSYVNAGELVEVLFSRSTAGARVEVSIEGRQVRERA